MNTLFDPATTSPPRCTSCGATDKNDCRHNRERDLGLISVTRRRPKECVAGYDPRKALIPF